MSTAPRPTFSARVIVGLFIYVFLTPAILFIAAGTLDWPMGLALAALQIITMIGSRLVLLLKHPDLLQERGRYTAAEGVKSWDRILVPLVGMIGPLLMLVVAGLDRRFGWSPAVPLAWQIAGAVLVAVGYFLATWAMWVNRFFATVARIQADRGQTVVTTGPYRLVRHPGYAGGVLSYLATPVMLGTLWALVPAVLTVATVVIRTALEDRMLRTELAGYEDYTRHTRSRLLPGIW